MFIWDAGSQPYVADADDIFFDWTVPCSTFSPTVSYDQTGGPDCSACAIEFDRIRSLLNRFKLKKDDFNGALLRARLGVSSSPLFVLAPSIHPRPWLDTLRMLGTYERSYALHRSNILDFLQMVDRVQDRQQSVSNVSETLTPLLDSHYLQTSRQAISETIRREDYLSNDEWAHAILQRGPIDASVFLALAFEGSDALTHFPIEPCSSYVNSVLLNTVLAMRQRRGIANDETLYDAFSAEYELGLAYFGGLEHRFSSSAAMEQFRKSWGRFKEYSQLPQPPLLQALSNNCEQRSRNMATQLMNLAATERADYYLVTFGPLHLHGILGGLEKNGYSYLLIAPGGERTVSSE
jgi:hypothetical protein